MYIHIYIYVCIHLSLSLSLALSIYMYIYIYICMSAVTQTSLDSVTKTWFLVLYKMAHGQALLVFLLDEMFRGHIRSHATPPSLQVRARGEQERQRHGGPRARDEEVRRRA